jgi:uncharacterized membrane protein YoaT (DUF817 family)
MLAYTKSRFHSVRIRFENHVPSSPRNAMLWEIFLFAFKQAWACLFGGLLLSLVLLTKWFWPHAGSHHHWIARYDFLFLAALTIQILMLVLRMETVREAKIILVFHVVGTLMELFKTSVGSWAYPELATANRPFFHIAHVPLFSGFMYASVGSFLARVTRIVDMRYTRYPNRAFTVAIAMLIYANFFTHHYVPDIRIVLFALVVIAFGPTMVYYRPYRKYRRMPLVVGFALVAFFIWAAENIGTFAAAWVYPNQKEGWQLVYFSKYGSWFLLMIISFILVSLVHTPRLPPLEELAPVGPDLARPSRRPDQNPA